MSIDNEGPHEVESRPENLQQDRNAEQENDNTQPRMQGELHHKRVGRTEPTEEVKERLEKISDQFILEDPPETVGGNISDTDQVRSCLRDAIDYCHENLTEAIRKQITAKWGISNEMIDAKKIGFIDSTNEIIEHLHNEGYDSLTIIRASLGTDPHIQHVFECRGVSEANSHLTNGREAEVDNNCSHTVDSSLDTLVQAQIQGIIEPHQIDLKAVSEHIDEINDRYIRNWWDNRIVFPYRNEMGDFCYLIVRATAATDDIIYNNGVTDRSDDVCAPLSETMVGREMVSSNIAKNTNYETKLEKTLNDIQVKFTEEILNHYTVLPHKSVFNTPYERENQDELSTAIETIARHWNGDNTIDQKDLINIGVLHHEETVESLREDGATRVHIFDGEDIPNTNAEYFITPVAVGINPGMTIEFTNHTNHNITFEVATTPDNIWWTNRTIKDRWRETCPEEGLYRYKLNIQDGNEQTIYRGIFVVYDEIYTDSRSKKIEQWVKDEPAFAIDKAKYIKQTIDRPWINTEAITEPIFGCETVNEGADLLITEGVTDAIVAHQYGFPCIAPATTNFKQHHYEQICRYAKMASKVYVVNDNEENNAGTHGALRTAKVIEENGQQALVGTLPRPQGKDKTDLADYFRNHTRKEFIQEMKDAVRPENHGLYCEQRHNPTRNKSNNNRDKKQTDSGNTEKSSFDETDITGDRSALYELSIADVINFNALSTSGSSGSELYRGVNPIEDHGKSNGYFRIKDHGDHIEARDFKIEYGSGSGFHYNALTYLATAATCDCDIHEKQSCDCTRSVRRPMGSLSNSEVWWAWKYAKEQDHIPMPEDDPVPTKALWFLSEYHDILPETFIPESFDDDKRLPPTKYNQVLEIIKTEYGLNPGRSKIPTE